MAYDLEYYEALNNDTSWEFDRFKFKHGDDKKLEKLQDQCREAMKRLREIRDMDNKKLTDEIRAERDTLLKTLKAACDEMDKLPRVPSDDFSIFIGGDGSRQAKRPYTIRTANESREYRSMFGENSGYQWVDRDSNFWQAVFSGRHHPELTQRAMVIGIPSDGGFLIPSEQAEQIHAVALENELILPRCSVAPMLTNERKIPAMEIGDHSSNLYGGFTASYKAEEGTLSEADPKARAMTLQCKKLTGLLKFSNELLEDLGDGGKGIVDLCGKGLAWYRDVAFLRGTGAGEPLGILNSPCLVVQDKEAGQVADTIVWENITKMFSRMYAGSLKNSVWICNQTCIPSLLSLSIDVGTGGSHVPVLIKGGPTGFEILTRPVIFTEKTPVLGDQGDIILADLSQYVVGLRSDLRIDFSPHVYFTTDHTAARLISRHDGQPLWDEALTTQDGSNTVSPFVTLQAR